MSLDFISKASGRGSRLAVSVPVIMALSGVAGISRADPLHGGLPVSATPRLDQAVRFRAAPRAVEVPPARPGEFGAIPKPGEAVPLPRPGELPSLNNAVPFEPLRPGVPGYEAVIPNISPHGAPRIDLPPGWRDPVTGLPRGPSRDPVLNPDTPALLEVWRQLESQKALPKGPAKPGHVPHEGRGADVLIETRETGTTGKPHSDSAGRCKEETGAGKPADCGAGTAASK